MWSYFDGLLRYFDLSGRSTRRQYWLFWLVGTLFALAGALADLEFFYSDLRNGHPGPFTAFLSIVHLLPGIAVTVRRLHDIGRSGWWYFVQCIPIIGQLLMLFWMLAPPNEWDNEFGAPPPNRGAGLSRAPGSTQHHPASGTHGQCASRPSQRGAEPRHRTLHLKTIRNALD